VPSASVAVVRVGVRVCEGVWDGAAAEPADGAASRGRMQEYSVGCDQQAVYGGVILHCGCRTVKLKLGRIGGEVVAGTDAGGTRDG